MVSLPPLERTFAGKTVLVTGDTGFKGSWLAIWLRELGAKVVGLALPATSPSDNFVACGVADLIDHRDADVRNYEQVLATLSEHRPDVVFHLAAQSIVLDSYQDPRTTFDTNVMGTVNVLEAIRHTPAVRAVVVVTSDKCYENREWERGYRETDPLGGHDPYSASKGAAEIATASMRRSFFDGDDAANIATARAGNVVGAGDWAAHRIFPDCVRALMKDEPIVIRSPHAVRPWQHVLDALHGYLCLASALLVHGQRYAGAWNFGPAPSAMIPVGELVKVIVDAWGEGAYRWLEPDALRPAEARFLHLDISKAMSELDWTPTLDLAQAVAMCIEGYKAEGLSLEDLHRHRVAQITQFQKATHG